MRKKKTCRKKTASFVCMAVIATLAASAAMAGCSRKGSRTTGAGIETEAPMELSLSCYLTGSGTFTDAEGKEQTSIRFLVENDDKENKDWVKGINGKEFLKAGKKKVQVYSRYINDHCRYVDGSIPGNVSPEDVMYTAGSFTCGGWKQAGDEQYHEIGAIVEDGVPYFYTGCGVSTGLSGERVMCVWLAGFTPDSVPVDGVRPRFGCADRFSLVTADGGRIPSWEGMEKEPELSVNEFGVEVTIQAEDADVLMRSIARTGLFLRHESEEGVVSDFELEKKMQEDSPEEGQEENAEAAKTTGAVEDSMGAEDTGDTAGTGTSVGKSAEGTSVEESAENAVNAEAAEMQAGAESRAE